MTLMMKELICQSRDKIMFNFIVFVTLTVTMMSYINGQSLESTKSDSLTRQAMPHKVILLDEDVGVRRWGRGWRSWGWLTELDPMMVCFVLVMGYILYLFYAFSIRPRIIRRKNEKTDEQTDTVTYKEEDLLTPDMLYDEYGDDCRLIQLENGLLQVLPPREEAGTLPEKFPLVTENNNVVMASDLSANTNII